MLLKTLFTKPQNSARLFSTALLKSLEKKVTIETEELQELLDENRDDLAVLNSTIPRRNYDPYQDHMLERIPQSIYMDFKGFTDPNTHLSYMMPDE